MTYDIHFQIAALVVVVAIVVFFYRSKRIQLKSNQVFSILMFISLFTIVLDIFATIALAELEEPSVFTVRVIAVSCLTVVSYFPSVVLLYILSCVRKFEKVNYKITLLVLLPAFITTTIAWITPISIVGGKNEMTLVGVGMAATYLGTLIYVIASIVLVRRNKSQISITFRRCIYTACAIQVVLCLVEFFFHNISVISFGTAIIILMLYTSLENPLESIEKSTGAFTFTALIDYMTTLIIYKKRFSLFVVSISDYHRICSAFGIPSVNELMHNFVVDFGKTKDVVVAKVDNDRIAVIYKCKKEEAIVDVERIRKCLNDTVMINGAEYMLTPHYCFLNCPEDVDDVNTIIDVVNYSLLEAKEQGRGALILFNEQFIAKQKRVMLVEHILEEAVENERLDVYYQPIFSVKDQRFTTTEALVRLQETSHGFISPDEFIPIAEKSGLILKLGLIVFEKVCSFARSAELSRLGIEYIEVNLSGVQCMQSNLAEQLHEVMKRYGISPSFINLEVTETAALYSDENLINTMDKIIAYGSSFSLDDYGTGYSSIQYMVKFPFSIVKLDKSIVWAFFEKDNEKARTIMASNVTMIKQLGMKIVAEGVESFDQAKLLSEIGIDYLQGFYYSRPIPPADFIMFISYENGIKIGTNE